MGLLLAPATAENLQKSIENSIDISFARKYLSNGFVDEILKYSGGEGIRCFALTKNSKPTYDKINNGDEVLFSKKNTGLFTHYGVVIGKVHNVDFGENLWPELGKNPWEYIYFVGNITQVNIDKKALLTKLGYKENFVLPGIAFCSEEKTKDLVISETYEIPVSDNIWEVNPEANFFGENIKTIGTRRKGHTEFSKNVKDNYDYKCAVCGISDKEFLVAGHISSWAEDPDNRTNRQNGICLCSLHDKAFEKGYIGLSDDYKIIINTEKEISMPLLENLKMFENKAISLPKKESPDKGLLQKHREKHNLK